MRNIALWGLQIVLALLFVAAGSSKLGGSIEMVEMFDDIGAGQWFRYLTGTLELAGAVGLMIPRVRRRSSVVYPNDRIGYPLQRC